MQIRSGFVSNSSSSSFLITYKDKYSSLEDFTYNTKSLPPNTYLIASIDDICYDYPGLMHITPKIYKALVSDLDKYKEKIDVWWILTEANVIRIDSISDAMKVSDLVDTIGKEHLNDTYFLVLAEAEQSEITEDEFFK